MPDHGVDITIGVEASQDYDYASVAAAWWDHDEVPHVALVGYLDGGADRVPEVVARLGVDHDIVAVLAGDRAGNLVPYLGDVAPTVSRATRADEADAHAEFRDRIRSRRIRVRSRPELRRAIRAGRERRIGQAGGWLRRDTEVDMAPAVAVELALWALIKTPVLPEPDIF
jgi:hypothetical protein